MSLSRHFAKTCRPLMLTLPVLLLATIPASATPVTIVEIGTRTVSQHIPLSGTLTADQVSALSPAVAGLVSRVLVDLGDTVEPGQPLVELDAELARLGVAGAAAQIDQARAALDDARRRLEEASSLNDSGSLAASQVRTLESEVAMASASLAAATAESRRQQALLERHAIRAPFSGVISAREAQAGEWVTPGDTVLELVDTSLLRADFAVPQQYFSRLKPDAELRVEGQDAPANIVAIVPVNDPGARTFLLRARLQDAERLTPGMSVQATLVLSSATAQLTVPRDALVRYPDGRVAVWLAVREGDEWIARQRMVRVGTGFAEDVEVLDGLEPGQHVIVLGNETLQDGVVIQVRDH